VRFRNETVRYPSVEDTSSIQAEPDLPKSGRDYRCVGGVRSGSFLVFAFILVSVSGYDAPEEVEAGNLACGLALGCSFCVEVVDLRAHNGQVME